MTKILIPVDGSPNALEAVHSVAGRFGSDRGLEIHLLHVRTPLSQYVSRIIGKRDHEAWHRDEAEKALAGARAALEKFGIPYTVHVEVGDKAAAIDRLARSLELDRIVLGAARKNSLTRLLESSITNRVLELTHVPVEVVPGQSVSAIERIAVPAGLGAALALLVDAID